MFGLLRVWLVATLPSSDFGLSDSLYASAEFENRSKPFKLTHYPGLNALDRGDLAG